MPFLFSCASTKKVEGADISPVYITNVKKFYLLPPECIENPIDDLQLLVGSFGKNSFRIQTYIKADETGIFLSIFNDFGTGMGELIYSGNEIVFKSAVFPKAMKPEYIVSDLQFAYYKPDILEESLKSIDIDFTVDKSADGIEKRRIMNGKKCIEEVIKTSGTIKIINYLRGYEYNLQEVSE